MEALSIVRGEKLGHVDNQGSIGFTFIEVENFGEKRKNPEFSPTHREKSMVFSSRDQCLNSGKQLRVKIDEHFSSNQRWACINFRRF